MNRDWYNTHPKRVNATDLLGKKLKLTSIPPEDTTFGGMKILTVKDEDGNLYRIMVTDQDVSKAVDLYVYSGDAAFTFQPSEKEPEKYAEVVALPKKRGA